MCPRTKVPITDPPKVWVSGQGAQQSAREIAWEWWRGQNYLRKTVIGGNVAFRMG